MAALGGKLTLSALLLGSCPGDQCYEAPDVHREKTPKSHRLLIAPDRPGLTFNTSDQYRSGQDNGDSIY